MIVSQEMHERLKDYVHVPCWDVFNWSAYKYCVCICACMNICECVRLLWFCFSIENGKAVFKIVTICRRGQDLMSKTVGFVSKDVAGLEKKTNIFTWLYQNYFKNSLNALLMYVIYSFLVQMDPWFEQVKLSLTSYDSSDKRNNNLLWMYTFDILVIYEYIYIHSTLVCPVHGYELSVV